ncbi:MAG: Asp-tRNA(Asn)/Glu-tRNA(Gln) amidotransferase subunit GatC, partial [Singulisphaera sp.]
RNHPNRIVGAVFNPAPTNAGTRWRTPRGLQRLAVLEPRAALWQTDGDEWGLRSGRSHSRPRFPDHRGARRMGLSADEVAKVALLARLRISPDELETFTGQLNSIVEFVAQLQELPTADVEPLAHGVEVRNVFRDDVRGPSLPREAALANAPRRNAESFLVPAVLE